MRELIRRTRPQIPVPRAHLRHQTLDMRPASIMHSTEETVRCATDARNGFPLPFRRGERQGEGTHKHLPTGGSFPLTPLLDPLPSSNDGRGNPITPVSRTRSWFTEGDRMFPLPFTRGEDQGEGLIRRPFVSLTKWQGIPVLSPSTGERENRTTATIYCSKFNQLNGRY